MIGTQVASPRLFYDFCLDDYVPSDHLLRRIDQFLDLESVRAELRPFYSKIGRPSIDPELMMRMLIIGYSMGIRSERRLCEEVHLNLAYRWFCRLGLDGKVQDRFAGVSRLGKGIQIGEVQTGVPMGEHRVGIGVMVRHGSPSPLL